MQQQRQDKYPHSPILEQAREAFEDGQIGWDVYQAFRSHVHAALKRGIPFLFTIWTWWNFWQTDSRWHHRGIGKNKLVMARKGDTGPYSPENVFCCSHSQNVMLIDKGKLSRSQRAAYSRRKSDPNYSHHLAVRGDSHPKSKAVITPNGRFGSLALAGEAYGKTRQWAFYKVKDKAPGWRYETEADKAPAPLPDAKFKLAAD